MWFDAQRALAELLSRARPKAEQPDRAKPRVARVAHVAQGEGPSSRSDEQVLAEHLRLNGPATYGGVALALGWSPTRAWRAEAALVERGYATYDTLGRAVPDTPRADESVFERT